MVVIRLASSGGRKKLPFRHIVVTDKRTKRDSFIEKLGYFNPIKQELSINTERYQYWIQQGAQISPGSRVKRLFKQWLSQSSIADNTNHAQSAH